MADEEFEKAFGGLAYAELEQKASGLFPYLVGFQMVQKNDDDSHAVGVFGFKVGDQWYYVPVFWLNAKIKGYDLLYIVGQDLFVPLQESWVNYITNRKPNKLGEPEEQSLSDLGSMPPSFDIFSQSPLTKGACYSGIDKDTFEEWCRPSLMYAKPSEKSAGVNLDLTDRLSKDCPEFTATLLKTMGENTKFAEAVYTFYSPSKIVSTSAKAKSAMIRKEAVDRFVEAKKPQKVQVKYGPGAMGPDTVVSESAKERLMSGEAVVSDNRDEKDKAEVYAKPDFERTLVNPDSGVSSILTDEGQFIDALVIKDPVPIGETKSRVRASVVVDLSKKSNRKFTVCNSKGVFSRGTAEANTKNPKAWEEAFESFRSSKNVGKGDVGMFVSKNMKGSFPFWVMKSQNLSNGTKVLQVKPIDSICKGAKHPFSPVQDDEELDTVGTAGKAVDAHRKPIGDYRGDVREDRQTVSYTDHDYEKESKDPGCCHKIIISSEPHGMHTSGPTLMLSSEDTKFIHIGNIGVPGSNEHGHYSWPKEWYVTSKGTLSLGSTADIDRYIMKTGMQTIRVKAANDFEIDVTFEGRTERRMNKNAALRKMVTQIGLGEHDARSLIKNASLQGTYEALVKKAQGYSLGGGAPAAYDSNYQAQATQPYDETYTLDSNAPGPDPRESMKPIDPEVQRIAIDAAQKGQKEVFDLSVLQGLIQIHDIDDLVDDLLKDIIKGNDKVGRILFMYYWHYDEFVTRYGDEDMRELEDTLRDVFKSTGELVLFLKQRSLEPGAADRLSVDIGDAPAGAGL